MKLEQAFQLFLNGRRGEVSEETIKWYQRRLGPLLQRYADYEIEAITTDDLREYRASLMDKKTRWETHPTRPTEAGGLSPYTLHQYIRAVRTFFKWLKEEEKIDVNPAARLGLPRLPQNPPKAVQENVLLKMIEWAAQNASKRDYALLCFLADTNARAGGVATLTVADLNLENRTAVVREKGNGGNARARRVSFKQRTAQALQQWLAERPAGDYVFVSYRAPHLSPSGIHTVIEKIARKAGVEGRHNPHGFRHGWAMGALRRGADLATVSQDLGHSSVVVTAEFYARWSSKELAERHEKFSWLPEEK